MEFLRSFLKSHFAGKPIVASRNVSHFVRVQLLLMLFSETKIFLHRSIYHTEFGETATPQKKCALSKKWKPKVANTYIEKSWYARSTIADSCIFDSANLGPHVSKSLTPILTKLCRFPYLSMKKLIFSRLKIARVTLVKSSIVCLSSGENNQTKPVPYKMHNIKRYWNAVMKSQRIVKRREDHK